MEFRSLGPLTVTQDGSELVIPAGKPRLLLAVLLCAANKPVSVERLVDALWSDIPPKSATDNLRVYVSQLRKALGDSSRIVHQRLGYTLVVHPGELDADRFDELLAEGRACDDPARASALLHEALALFRGTALADVPHVDAIANTVRRLDEQRATAAEESVEADLALGRIPEAIAELRGLIHEHPLRERLHAQLMLALYRSGRQAEALAAYQDARKLLVEELGIEPGAALRELESRMLNGDPALHGWQPSIHQAIPPAVPRLRLPWGSWLWAAVPLLSCGYGTPWAFVYAAVKRRSLGLALSALVYFGLAGIFLIVPFTDDDGLNKLDIIPMLALVSLWMGGTCHAVLVREHVFAHRPSRPMSRGRRVAGGVGLIAMAAVATAGYWWLEPPT